MHSSRSNKHPSRAAIAAGVLATALAPASSCAGAVGPPARPASQDRPARTAPSAAPSATLGTRAPPAPSPTGPQPGASSGAEAPEVAEADADLNACPMGMVHVRTDWCPRVHQHCVRELVSKPDLRRICELYRGPTECLSGRLEHLDFCIDRYEYPNRRGAHPVPMASWYDAATSCHALGKRLCWEAEWTAACEGPERVAFPYGWIRDAERCNLDHPSMMAFQRLLYSDDPATRRAEILRLDRSVPSGSMPLCVSDFGVRDMTGNYDEWVNAEEPTGVSQWAALKGGPWVRSRNACRPIFRGHSPGFRFHFISFRCCADARGATPRRPLGGLLPPRVPERLADEPWWPGRVVEAWE